MGIQNLSQLTLIKHLTKIQDKHRPNLKLEFIVLKKSTFFFILFLLHIMSLFYIEKERGRRECI